MICISRLSALVVLSQYIDKKGIKYHVKILISFPLFLISRPERSVQTNISSRSENKWILRYCLHRVKAKYLCHLGKDRKENVLCYRLMLLIVSE